MCGDGFSVGRAGDVDGEKLRRLIKLAEELSRWEGTDPVGKKSALIAMVIECEIRVV